MRFLSILGSSVFQILSLIFVLGYLFGVLNLYFSDKNNYCIMTYMFEYPQFVVSINQKPINNRFNLIAMFLIMNIFSDYLFRRIRFIPNMGYMRIVKEDSQREPEKCGMY